MEGYTIAAIVKAMLEKGLNPSVILGFGLVGLLLRQGIQIARDYASGKDNATNELLAFIRANQQRQDSREDGFVQATRSLAENLAAINVVVTEHRRAQEAWNEQTTGRMEKMHRDIWAARGGGNGPHA